MERTLNPGVLSTVPSLVSGLRLRVDAVPDTRHRGDDPGFAEPFAQRGDGDAYGVGEGVDVLVPGPFEELFGADDPALGGDEDVEDGELFAGERDIASVAEDLPAEGVEPEARDLADGGRAYARLRSSALSRRTSSRSSNGLVR